MNEIDNILYENLSPDRYCLVHNQITKLQQENQRLLELCMYALISSTKIYNHELANDTKQAFMKIVKENLNDDTGMLRNKIEKYWNGDK